MKEKKKICKICKEDKESLKKRRYPLFFNHYYCDDCYNTTINNANAESIKFLLIVLIVCVIGAIVDFTYCIPEQGFPLATIGAWALLTIFLWKSSVFSGIQDFLSGAFVFATIDDWLDGMPRDNTFTLSIFWGLKLIVFIIKMLLFLLVILLVLIRFINTLMIIKNVKEKIRMIVLAIMTIIFIIASCLVIGLLLGVNF